EAGGGGGDGRRGGPPRRAARRARPAGGTSGAASGTPAGGGGGGRSAGAPASMWPALTKSVAPKAIPPAIHRRRASTRARTAAGRIGNQRSRNERPTTVPLRRAIS